MLQACLQSNLTEFVNLNLLRNLSFFSSANFNEQFMAILERQNQLAYLEVGESWLSKESSAKVLRILSRSQTIQTLGMSYCDLSMDDAWQSLAYLLANAPKLTSVDITC